MSHVELSLKYRKVYAFLKEGIQKQRFPTGSRLPTESELMAQFGVSRPTAVRAFHELENDGLVERRRGSGSYVKKTPAETSRRMFGLMISGLFASGGMDQSIFVALTGALARAARANHAAILFSGALNEQAPEQMIRHAEQMAAEYIEQGVAGVFFVPLLLPAERAAANRNIAQMFEKRNVPVVLLDRDLYEGAQRSRYDLSALDHHQAGYQLCAHLLEQGCRRVDFVMGATAAASIQARVAGWREALLERGIVPATEWLHQETEFCSESTRTLTAACSGADGVICYNDDVAVWLGQALQRSGIRVPEDLLLAGFDHAPVGRLFSCGLTTMEQPVELIGQGALELMLRRIDTPTTAAQTRLFAPALIAKESSARQIEA